MDINQQLETTFRNLRQAARALAKAPGFTATVVVTLALGIGANSAVFSAIYAVLLRPLPFPDADRLMIVAQSNPKARQPFVAPVRIEDWNRLNTTFQAISGYYTQDDSELSGELPERLTHAFVAPRFLQVWGIAPALGRDFTPLDPTCSCFVCARYTRAYLGHLLRAKELAAYRLLSYHNLHFMHTIMNEVRASIIAGRFQSARQDFMIAQSLVDPYLDGAPLGSVIVVPSGPLIAEGAVPLPAITVSHG